MDMSTYKDEIRLRLTGYILDMEIDDSILEKIINSAFREIQRYIDTTKLATLPYKPCIDLSDCGVSSVSRVFRADNYSGTTSDESSNQIDPMFASQWQILSGNAGAGNFSN